MEQMQYKVANSIVQLGNDMTWLLNQKLQSMGLTSSQSAVIRYIMKNQNERIAAKNLATYLGLSQSTMAGIIKRLESKALIRRKADDIDGRKIIITTTDKGLSLDNYIKETVCQTEKILLSGMSCTEKQEFIRLLRVALDNMSELKSSGGVKSNG